MVKTGSEIKRVGSMKEKTGSTMKKVGSGKEKMGSFEGIRL